MLFLIGSSGDKLKSLSGKRHSDSSSQRFSDSGKRLSDSVFDSGKRKRFLSDSDSDNSLPDLTLVNR